jgi:hypothetical protein
VFRGVAQPDLAGTLVKFSTFFMVLIAFTAQPGHGLLSILGSRNALTQGEAATCDAKKWRKNKFLVRMAHECGMQGTASDGGAT